MMFEDLIEVVYDGFHGDHGYNGYVGAQLHTEWH